MTGHTVGELEAKFLTFLLQACKFLGQCSTPMVFRPGSVEEAVADSERADELLAMADRNEELSVAELEHRPFVVAMMVSRTLSVLAKPLIPSHAVSSLLDAAVQGTHDGIAVVVEVIHPHARCKLT